MDQQKEIKPPGLSTPTHVMTHIASSSYRVICMKSNYQPPSARKWLFIYPWVFLIFSAWNFVGFTFKGFFAHELSSSFHLKLLRGKFSICVLGKFNYLNMMSKDSLATSNLNNQQWCSGFGVVVFWGWNLLWMIFSVFVLHVLYVAMSNFLESYVFIFTLKLGRMWWKIFSGLVQQQTDYEE